MKYNHILSKREKKSITHLVLLVIWVGTFIWSWEKWMLSITYNVFSIGLAVCWYFGNCYLFPYKLIVKHACSCSWCTDMHPVMTLWYACPRTHTRKRRMRTLDQFNILRVWGLVHWQIISSYAFKSFINTCTLWLPSLYHISLTGILMEAAASSFE